MARARRTKADDANGTPPETPTPGVTDGGGETTGRYIIIFKDDAVGNPAAAKAVLSNVAGIRDMGVAADYDDSAVTGEDLADTEGMYFNTLGIAVVSGEPGAMQSLATAAADTESPI